MLIAGKQESMMNDTITRLREKTTEEVESSISHDRKRTNLLKDLERSILVFLVQRVPGWVSPNMLTMIGFTGSLLVFAGFILAAHLSRYYLLLGIPGMLISWLGDSLDGRLAYFRKKPRKFYGFTLDITTDWLGIILLGCGYIIYSTGHWKLVGYGIVVMYGWEMIIALMRYKITGKYSIDSGKLGPTEARIIISAILALEVLVQGSIKWSALAGGIILLFSNIIDTRQLLNSADEQDFRESGKTLTN